MGRLDSSRDTDSRVMHFVMPDLVDMQLQTFQLVANMGEIGIQQDCNVNGEAHSWDRIYRQLRPVGPAAPRVTYT